MNKSSGGKNAFDTELLSKTDASLQAGAESARMADPRVPSEATERRSPHRVISTASYYHPERRSSVVDGIFDEFPEGPEPGNEMDGDSGDGSFS